MRSGLLVFLLALLPSWAVAERDSVRAYVFGNSLVHHLGEEDHSNVPHWVNQMARAHGHKFAVDGQWGFLRNFADGLPPTANWSFPGVSGAWSPDNPFGSGRWDAVIVTPANFIQYQQPDVPFDGDNPTGESPLGATLRLMDWVVAEAPETRLFVYEGWAEMSSVTGGFPPAPPSYANYIAVNAGPNHQWFRDLIAGIDATRPALQPQLIPVASVLADLKSEGGPLAGLPPTALYVDGEPHGTATLYFLAAMVTYAALYEAPPPPGYQPPASLHPDVVAAYPQIAQAIWQAMSDMPRKVVTRETPRETASADPLPPRETVVLPPRGVRPDGIPALGMGLNGIADWSTQHPFIDLMKTARDWVGHLPGQWGGVSSEQLRADGHLSENGWPVSIPDGVEALESVLLTDQPKEAEHLRGDYVLFYEGTGKLRLTGRASRVRYEEGEIRFSYSPGEGVVGISITEVSAGDPIRNIRIIRQDHLALHQAGVLFNPLWINRIRDLRSVRFMDWMLTNGSPIQSWEDRPRMEDATWTAWGVPAEVMIDLVNQIGADPWFNMPHMADDTYVRNFAALVRDRLDPRLKAYVEYSNEVWNFIFPQAQWAGAQAEKLWGASDTGWIQFYALRSAQVMDIWTEVFGAQSNRLVRTVATHTGWPGLEEDILLAPLAYLALGGRAPQDSFDAYAVTGYFGFEMGGEEFAPRMRDWLDRAEEIATETGEKQGLRRVALREFVRDARFEAAIAPVTLALQDGSLRELVEEIFPYHGAVARRAGLDLVMYEGGTHVSGHGGQVNDERLTGFFTTYNYTPEMAKLYELLLAGWVEAGGTLFNAFVDVAPATQWGSWGALRHLDDSNPRWDMLMAFNATGPNGWEQRDPAAFSDGVLVSGNGQITGTAEEDILLGGRGADVLISAGGSDHIHGGAGQDRAVLPGARADYSIARIGERLVLESKQSRIHLFSIEQLSFDGAPDQVVSVSDL